MAGRKNVSVEKTLGKLTPQQRKELANAYNGGLGSGMTPDQWKKAQAKKTAGTKKKTATKKK